ncbi:MAG: DUF4003 family protein [Lachnospiraceae bacterium]|nr:DUF4003 family protein [Lachnospiraceae bacterium]
MNEIIRARLDLLCDNYQAASAYTHFDNNITRIFSSLVCCNEGKSGNPEKIKEMKALIKEKAGIFSRFRNNLLVPLSTELSLEANPEQCFLNTLHVYDLLKQQKFSSSDYLAAAAHAISTGCEPFDYPRICERAKTFYQDMKENHPFLTGQNDYVYAAMLAMSDLSPQSGTNRMELFYINLKKHFGQGNGLQSLSHILCMADETDSLVIDRVISLHDKLKEMRFDMNHPYTLSLLGILALITDDMDAMAADIAEAHNYLKDKKGFGSWSLTKAQRLLITSSVVATVYADQAKSGTLKNTIASNITNLLLAEQAAMIAMITAASVSTAASSSN